MKRLLSSFLILSIILCSTAFTQTIDKQTEKVRKSVAKIGTGSDAKVEVTLIDGSKEKGYIGTISNDSFSLVDEKTGNSKDLNFDKVNQVKKRGELSRETKIIIGIAAAGAGAILFGLFLKRCRNELGCGASR